MSWLFFVFEAAMPYASLMYSFVVHSPKTFFCFYLFKWYSMIIHPKMSDVLVKKEISIIN